MSEIDVTVNIGRVIPIAVTSQYDPVPTGLAAAPQVGGGTFAAGTYYWVITGTDALGETTRSAEVNAAVALNGSCILTWSPLVPGTTGVKVYRGTVPGTENALIATLGNVTTFTDTGTAGSGATPPATNTAEISTVLVYNGECRLIGFGLRETSGTAKADIGLRNAAQEVVPVVIPSGTSQSEYFGEPGIHMRSGVFIGVNSGVYAGSVYLVPLDQ